MNTLDDKTVEAICALHAKGLLSVGELARRLYKLGFETGYKITDAQKQQEKQVWALNQQASGASR